MSTGCTPSCSRSARPAPPWRSRTASRRADYIRLPRIEGEDERETSAWVQAISFDAIRDAIADAEAAFRKSLTPEQALARVIGGPKAVVA